MFQMNVNASSLPNAQQRYLQFDGMLHYYKNGWLSNKWIVVYAKLWSDSTLEWFQSKGSDKPAGSVFLSTLIPYIAIGTQIRKVPSKKPKVEASWNRNLLMAIATDQKASSVHWFYFDEGNNLRKWLSEITKTLPRLNAPAPGYYPYPRNDVLDYGHHQTQTRPMPNAFPTPPMTTMDDQNRGMHVSFHSNSRHEPRKRSSFDSLFDDTMMNYGVGSFFFPMEFNETSSSSDESEDDDDNHVRRHKSNNIGHGTVFNDGNVHVSQIGDATSITLRSDSNDDRNHPNPNEFGSGFGGGAPRVHHIDL